MKSRGHPRRRRHRIVVEVCFTHGLSEDDAVRAMRLMFSDRLDKSLPIWAFDGSPSLMKLEPKSFSRVINKSLALRMVERFREQNPEIGKFWQEFNKG